MWQAIVAADTAALQRLRLTETEHNEGVWPELPASEPGTGFPVELAWLNIESRNRAAVEEVMSRYAGSSMEYVATTCDSAIAYASFTIHSDCRVTLRNGRPRTKRPRLELFRHALEQDGGWKVIRYYDPHD